MDIIIPKKDVVICYLLTEKYIWLGERKTEPWIGTWNGAGGKIEPGESPAEAQRREMQEEFGIDVNVTNLERVGIFNLIRRDKPDFERVLHIFIAQKWLGKPQETEAMIPRRILRSEIHKYFKKMLPGDNVLLPHILKGHRMEGSIIRKDEKGTLEDVIIKVDVVELSYQRAGCN